MIGHLYTRSIIDFPEIGIVLSVPCFCIESQLMINHEKIEEWIKEAEDRPESAQLILKHIADRLRDLTQRNEELLNENIALQLGNRVEEYARRIAHLEYQLELLRRHYGGTLPDVESLGPSGDSRSVADHTYSVLVYTPDGAVARLLVNPQAIRSGQVIARLPLTHFEREAPPRILATISSEELLFVFSSGRVSTLPVEEIPPVMVGVDQEVNSEQILVPHEPSGAESLVSLLPFSGLAMCEVLVQTSRRGYAKKIGAAMIESILANHFIGTGVRLPTDQTFHVSLCKKEDQLILFSRLGFLLQLNVSQLPHSIEEVMRLDAADHLVGALIREAGHSILIATQIGKLIHRTPDSFDTASSFRSRGTALYSKARREQGTRVVGAALVAENDIGVALHSQGQVSLHHVKDLIGSGTIPVSGELLAFTALALPGLSAAQV
jgi:DNA gyrase/topoisomerase IV subunit A